MINAILAFLAPLAFLLAPVAADDRPNIIFIMTDDHASAAVSAYGSRLNETPNIDRLAAEGVVFENAFCTNGICAPSRAVILTGKHSHLNGVRDNAAKFNGAQPTFPKLLRAAGYQTALFGKWHLKSDPTGFDAWQILPGQGHYYSPDLRDENGSRRVEGAYCTDLVTDLALEWLDGLRDPDRPFLLMVQHKAPHRAWLPGPDHLTLLDDRLIAEPATLLDDYATRGRAARMQEMTIAQHMYLLYDLKVPLLDSEEPQGPDRWAAGRMERMTPAQRAAWSAAYDPRNDAFRAAQPTGDDLIRWKYQRYIKDYLRCIASVDDNIGRLLDHLETRGLADDTIVVYTSDQGFFLGEHGWYDKRFMYEPALRMPLLVRWPGVVRPGTRDAHLVQNLDFAATFLEAAGVTVPPDMQGNSLVPILRGASPDGWRRSIYYQYFEQGIHAVEPHHGVRTDRYKLIRFPTLDEWELYDLATDPNEVDNVYGAAAYTSIAADLEIELARLREHYQVNE